MRQRPRSSSTKNLYIDIDGVILTRGGMPAQHLDKFLKYVVRKYLVFWLTSRCRGDTKYTVDYLSRFLPADIMLNLKNIKPTNFQLDKTEAIDFNSSFFWLDDFLFDSEKNALNARNKYQSWIEIDLIKNPDQLLYLINHQI